MSLQRVLELTPLSPAEVVYVTLSLLEELPSNHGDGRRLTPGDVRITDEGALLLTDRSTAPTADGADAVSAVGQMLVSALAAQDPLLEVALNSLSIGALGRTPATAAAALSHQLPALASPDVLAQARADLGAFVRRLHSPDFGTPLRQPPVAEAIEGGSQPPMAIVGVGVVVLVILAVILTLTGAGGLPSPKAASSRALPTPSSVEPTIQPTTLPTPSPTPVAYVPPGPPASGTLRGVALTPGGTCQVGGRCAASVELRFAGAGAPTALAWQVRFYDGCDGTSKTLGTGSFTAPAGWNHVISDASVAVPANLHSGRLVVVTSSPVTVASDPVDVAGPGCA
ncbi:MAG TPA: hypothetical protein VF160_08535 [Candidatus Dormibacteraeota bacterium]